MVNFLVTTPADNINGATNFDGSLWNAHNALLVPPPSGWTCQWISTDGATMVATWRIVDTDIDTATVDATALRRGHSEMVLSVAPE